jgi:hypothetical protein
VGTEHEDVGRHEDGVAVQAHGDAFVRILGLFFFVFGDCGFVGMGAVHQSLGRQAGEDPGQLRYFGDVGLTIENRTVRIQAQRKPRCRNLQRGLTQYGRIVAFDQGVVVGQKVEGFCLVGTAGFDGGTDGAHIIANMGGAGCRDAGQNGVAVHDFLFVASVVVVAGDGTLFRAESFFDESDLLLRRNVPCRSTGHPEGHPGCGCTGGPVDIPDAADPGPGSGGRYTVTGRYRRRSLF